MGHQTTTSLSYGFILSKEDLAKLYHVLEQYSQSQSKSAPPGDVQITPKETQKLHLGHIQNLMDMVSKFLNEHNDENFYPGDFLLKTSYDEYEESESLDRAAILYTGEYPSIMETQEGRAGYCLEVWGNEHGGYWQQEMLDFTSEDALKFITEVNTMFERVAKILHFTEAKIEYTPRWIHSLEMSC